MNILHLGVSGFPYGQADMQKAILLCKSLAEDGCSVHFVNVRGTNNKKLKINYQGEYQGIKYIYTSGIPYRAESFIQRIILRIKGRINEFKYLKKKATHENIDCAIIATKSMLTIGYYRIISKIFNFLIILSYMEYPIKMESRRQIIMRLNDFLFNNIAFHLVDGIFPISDFLMNNVKSKAVGKPLYKIPVLADFAEIDKIQIKLRVTANQNNFVYCGSAGYIETIRFILQAFDKIEKDEVYLYLIVNGTEKQLKTVKNLVKLFKNKNHVILKHNLSYEQLIEIYNSALALLIPLRNNIRDTARFPHKIGEYTAVGRPIITTNVGEIPNYFKHKVNAIIADEYNVDKYAELMEWVVRNIEKSNEIGKNGYKVGKENFDYKDYGKKLRSFIYDLKNGK